MGVFSCSFPNPLHHSPLSSKRYTNTHTLKVKTAMACMQQGDRKENPKQPNISISAIGRRFSEFVSSLKAEVPQQYLNPFGTLCIAVLGAHYTATIASLQEKEAGLKEELHKEREENKKLGNKVKHAVIYVQRLEAELDEAKRGKKKDEETLDSLLLSRVRILLMGLKIEEMGLEIEEMGSEIEDSEKYIRTLEDLLARKEVEMNGLITAYAESSEFAVQIKQLKHLSSELEALVSDIHIQSGKEKEEGPADI